MNSCAVAAAALMATACAGGGGGGGGGGIVTPPPPPPPPPYASNCTTTPGALSCQTGAMAGFGSWFSTNASGAYATTPFAKATIDVGSRTDVQDDLYVLSIWVSATDSYIDHNYSSFQASQDGLGRIRTGASVASSTAAADGSTLTLFDITNVLNGGLDYVQLGMVPTSGQNAVTNYFALGPRLLGSSMPQTGTAEFKGGTRGSYTSAAGARYQTAGDVSLTANFGVDSVEGSASNFKFLNASGAVVTAPADLDFDFVGRISVSTISAVATGQNMSGAIRGAFYGEPSGPPVEAGVTYFLTGPDGSSMIGAGGLKKQ